MDRLEARLLLEEFLQELKACPHRELQGLIRNPLCLERQGPSGTVYQMEYEALWDIEPGGDLRIIASIDDGRFLSALMPVSSGFLVSPQGELID